MKTSMRSTAYIGAPIDLELHPSLEPMRALLSGFVARRLRDALGRRAWQLDQVHAIIQRHGSNAVTCRVRATFTHGTTLVGTTTAAELQTAIETAIERVGQSLAARAAGSKSRPRM